MIAQRPIPPAPRPIPRRVLWEILTPVAQGSPPSPEWGLLGCLALVLGLLWALAVESRYRTPIGIPLAGEHPCQLAGILILVVAGGWMITRR